MYNCIHLTEMSGKRGHISPIF